MKRVIALGFFDGVHSGHGALLRAAKEKAAELGCIASALTFDSHPDAVVFGKTTPLINTLEDRKRLMLEQYAMDEVLTLPFDKAMMELPWEAFVETLLIKKYEAAAVVCGHDYSFGYHGEGTPQLLRKKCEALGISCQIMEPVMLNGTVISSTAIREKLRAGELAGANAMLGHPHFLTGTVVKGKQLGRTIGVPTANLLLPQGVLAPKFGVYIARVDGKKAVTNIGVRPTVDDGEQVTVESYLLDFAGDLYGKSVCIELLAYLRPEQKFASLDELKQQILQDAAKAEE